MPQLARWILVFSFVAGLGIQPLEAGAEPSRPHRPRDPAESISSPAPSPPAPAATQQPTDDEDRIDQARRAGLYGCQPADDVAVYRGTSSTSG